MQPLNAPLRFKGRWAAPRPKRKVSIGANENPYTIIFYLIFGAIFAGAGVFIIRDDRTAWIMALIFFGIGVVHIWGAIHTVLGRMRYGEVVLEMDGPAVIGEEFSARLVSPGGAGGARFVEATLNCKQVRWKDSSEGRGMTESVSWSATTLFPTTFEPRRAVWNLKFQLPANLPVSVGDSTSTRTAPGVYWEIQAHAGDVDGVDLMRGFRIPVVRHRGLAG